MIGSAWQAWWHPRKAYKEIDSLRNEVESLRGELSQIGEENAGLLNRNHVIHDDLEALRKTLEEEVASLKSVNREQAKRLSDWEAASIEMERVAGQLEKMSTMRDRMNTMRLDYEERIAKLERQLWSARSNGLQVAGMQGGTGGIEDSDLIEPGEKPYAPPLPIRMAPDRPKITPATDDTDWLLSLPPDL